MKRGTQIAYIPPHADSVEHPDVQLGFVTSVGNKHVFCRFWNGDLTDIVDKSCSKGVPHDHLVERDSVQQALVDEMLERWC